jgi:AcrR family transcriptional regulator
MSADVDREVPRRPGRPRSARAHEAVIEATLELLAAEGFRGLTVEGVAARSGVAKTTIYRWWPSKQALLLEALSALRQQATVPDTGNVRDDAVAHLRGHIETFRDPTTAPILADALAEALRNPELGKARPGFVAAQRAPFRQALARAVDRGELPADLDYELTMDLLIGPIVNRALATGGPLEPVLAERLVDIVFGGLRAIDSSEGASRTSG